MKKRMLSLLMVLSMIITMLPAGALTAFAADVPSDEITGEAEAAQKQQSLFLFRPRRKS